MTPLAFIKANLTSIGQIMLQHSPITGGIFVLAVVIENPKMAIMMLFAVFVANFFALGLKLNTQHFTQGLYGFSAALVGLFVAVFFKMTLISLLLTLFGAILAMGLQELGLRKALPLYTLPFIVASWGVYLLGTWLDLPTNDVGMALADIHFIKSDFIQSVLKSTGQVMFLGSILAGVLCLLGLFANDFRQHQGKYAIFALVGAIFATCFATMIEADSQMLAMGLWGYNSVLAVIALADKKPRFWLLGIAFSVGIQWGFTLLLDFSLMGGLLTLPFVLAVWVVLAIERL